MRSKISFLTLLVSSFLLVIAFQNCANVSENTPSNLAADASGGPSDGSINNCLAIAVPYVKLGFLFAGSAPASVDVDINGQLAYSDCGHGTDHGSLIRESHRLEFYKGFDSLNEVEPNLEIKLYNRNCSSGARTEIYSAQENQYESYSLCGTNSVRIDVDYVVN